MFRNSLKGLVSRGKESVVGLGAVQSIDKVGVIVDELSQLGRVLGLGDQLIYSQVGLVAMVRWVVRGLMMGWPMVRWFIMGRLMRVLGFMRVLVVIESAHSVLSGTLEPRPSIERSIIDAATQGIT